MDKKVDAFVHSLKGGFFVFYVIQHCFIWRPSDCTVSEDAGNEPRTVAISALTARRSNPSARSQFTYQTFQCLVIKNQDVDMGSVSCTLGGRLLSLVRRGARAGWGSLRIYFTVNQIKFLNFGYQKPGKGSGFNEYGCESLR